MHFPQHIDPLDPKATLADVVAKLNELIALVNAMWSPDDPEP